MEKLGFLRHTVLFVHDCTRCPQCLARLKYKFITPTLSNLKTDYLDTNSFVCRLWPIESGSESVPSPVCRRERRKHSVLGEFLEEVPGSGDRQAAIWP